MARVFAAAFLGKIVAALFIAVCVALGFGPKEWAAVILGIEPTLLARVGFLLVAAVTAAGLLWPLIATFTWRQPLRDAALAALDAADRAGGHGVFYSADRPPAEQLRHFMLWIVTDDDVRLYGRRPPSSNVRPIPPSERANLAVDDAGNLTDDGVAYEGVTVDRLDLWRFLRNLRREAKRLRA